MKYMDAEKASAGGSTQSGSIWNCRPRIILRHLVMPNRAAGTEKFLKWVAETLPKSTYVNIMAQYRVEYRAYDYPEIARGISAQEFLEAMDSAERYGLTNLGPPSVALRNFYRHRRSN